MTIWWLHSSPLRHDLGHPEPRLGRLVRARVTRHAIGWWCQNWLVVTGCHEFGIFPEILGWCHHPNWRFVIFFRGVAQPPTSTCTWYKTMALMLNLISPWWNFFAKVENQHFSIWEVYKSSNEVGARWAAAWIWTLYHFSGIMLTSKCFMLVSNVTVMLGLYSDWLVLRSVST